VLGCVREGQQTGDFRGDIDANALTVMAMGTIHMLALSNGPLRQRAAVARSVRGGLSTLLQAPSAGRVTSAKKRSI
jgi:hypothetical protein